MAKRRSRIRKKKYDACCVKKRENSVDGWSCLSLPSDLLVDVLMRLGFVDLFAFSLVCRQWRSIALDNRNKFMVSKSPMSLSFSPLAYEKTCYLEDFEGRRLKTILPDIVGRKCVGITCGYLILFGRKTRDFLLVNLITRDKLHFPDVPSDVPFDIDSSPLYLGIKAALVFSPSRSTWLFAFTEKCCRQIWFSVGGKGAWSSVLANSIVHDLHAFQGKMYTLNMALCKKGAGYLCEMILGPEPRLMLLKTKNFPNTGKFPEFVYSHENLYVKRPFFSLGTFEAHQLDFHEMKWVSHQETIEKYAFFSDRMHTTAVRRGLWDKIPKANFFLERMWVVST